MFPAEKVNPSTSGLWHHDLFKAWTDGSDSVEKGHGRGQLPAFLWAQFSGRTYKSLKHIHMYSQLPWIDLQPVLQCVKQHSLNPLLFAQCISSSPPHCKTTQLVSSSCSKALAFLSLVLRVLFPCWRGKKWSRPDLPIWAIQSYHPSCIQANHGTKQRGWALAASHAWDHCWRV